MRVIFLSRTETIILCFFIWGFIQASATLICMKLPDRFFRPEAPFYRAHAFERNGEIYNRIFKVHRWKRFLPDGGAVWKKNGFRKRNLKDMTAENLKRFQIESARGEMTHWLAISLFWVFGFIAAAYVLWMMLAYALAVNLPCIIAQRYNRPRVNRLLKRKQQLH